MIPQYKKAINLLKSVQRGAAKIVKGHEGKPYKEWLRSLGLSNLEEIEGRTHQRLHFHREGKRRDRH